MDNQSNEFVFKNKVESVVFTNQWNSDIGTIYYYDVKFENDEKIYSYGSKKFPQTLLRKGFELQYKLNVIDKGYNKTINKIIPVKPNSNNREERPTDMQPNELNDAIKVVYTNKQSALQATSLLIAHGIIPLSDMRIMFDRILKEYLND